MPKVADQLSELVDGQPLTTKNAPDWAAHNRAMGRGKDKSASPPAEQKTDPPDPSEEDHSGPQGESASASEAGKETQSQESKEKRDRSASGRFAELTAARKAAEERAEKAERELQELRKGTRKPEESAKAEPAKPAEVKTEAKSEDPRPKRSVFRADPKYKTWDEADDAYDEELYNWTQREVGRQTQQTEQHRAYEARVKPWIEKHPDIKEKIDASVKVVPQVNTGIQTALQAIGFSDHVLVGDVLYEMATNLDELKRITALPPAEAYKETRAIAERLSEPPKEAATEQTPEKKKPVAAQAKASPPPAVVNSAGNAGLNTRDAKSWKDHNLARGRKDGTAAGAY